MDAVETGVVAVADDMTGLDRGHREHKGRDQQDDAGAGREASRQGGLEGFGRVEKKGKGSSPAAWGRNFSNSCRFGGSGSARWCNSPASEPVSWGDPEIAASSQPGQSPQTFKYPSRREVLQWSPTSPSYSEPRLMGMMSGQGGDQ